MVDRNWPIVPQYGENDELVRILLHKDWYDELLSVYKWLLRISGVTSVTPPSNSALNEAGELFKSLIVDFEQFGWVFSISIIMFLYYAAQEFVSVGKFVYRRVGGFGQSSFGNSSFGRARTIIEEFPE